MIADYHVHKRPSPEADGTGQIVLQLQGEAEFTHIGRNLKESNKADKKGGLHTFVHIQSSAKKICEIIRGFTNE
jgi:hypothetical protein